MATGTAGAGRPFPGKPPAVTFEGLQPMSSLRISPSGVRRLGLALLLASTAAPAGQAQSTGAAPPPATRHAARQYVPPRTPWGDPDLQGNYTNKYEQSTPLERPAEFDGRSADEIQETELAAILARRQRQVDERQTGVGPDQFRDLLDVTKGARAWLIVDPRDGRIPPLTREAQRHLAQPDGGLDLVNARPRTAASSFSNGPFDGPEDLSLFDRCITRGLPGSMLPFLHGNSYQIVQAPGLVAIRYEIMHETRVIPLGGSPHVGKGLHLDMGDPRGHWDGDSLVVETTNFSDRSAYRSANGATLRIVERFTRSAPGKIEWAVTVDDPATWTRRWTFSMPLTMNDREAVLEFACHEGNYALPNILSAARHAP
jgi:hypothetical protein